jgi:hypothetical protein
MTVLRPQPKAERDKGRRKNLEERGDGSQIRNNEAKLDASGFHTAFPGTYAGTCGNLRPTLRSTRSFYVLHMRAMRLRDSAMAALHIACKEVHAGEWHSQPSGKHCYHRN